MPGIVIVVIFVPAMPGSVDVALEVGVFLVLAEVPTTPLLLFFVVLDLGVCFVVGVAVGRTLLRPIVGVLLISHLEAPSGIRAYD